MDINKFVADAINLPKEVKEILDKFAKANFQIYIVGGAVRDLLSEREVADWDFTTDAKPEEILKLFPEGFYDNKFGTVGVPVTAGPASSVSFPFGGPPSSSSPSSGLRASRRESPSSESPTVYEITTMRKEGDYRDHRHPRQVIWTDKIEEDLARRDFAINAMALGFSEKLRTTQKPSKSDSLNIRNSSTPSLSESFRIIDPFDGQQDLKDQLIRAVGDPNLRFKEDALRLIRAIRIAAQLGFQIEEKTFSAIKQNAKLISDIAYERIRDELFKLLTSPGAYHEGTSSAYKGLLDLKETGILEIILPEVTKTSGIVQEGPKHDRVYEIEDHLFRSMRETPSLDPLVKFAALLHDIGKAETYDKDDKGNVTFYNHEVVGAELAKTIAKRFNLSNKQTDKLHRLIRWHMFSMNENQTDAAIRRFINNVGKQNLEDMMAIRVGDRLGGDTTKPVSWRMEKFQEKIKQVLVKPFLIADLKVNGNDVMKVLEIKPSRKVGEILDQLFQEVLKDSSKNNREYLLERIKNLVA